MEVLFGDPKLERLESSREAETAWSRAVVSAFRKRLWFIRQAADERDFRSMKSLHFEKLKGKRSHQHSMRLNDQYRLVLELKQTGRQKQVTVISIEDYHS